MDDELRYIETPTLELCVAQVNAEVLSKNMSANIWRLTKIVSNGISLEKIKKYLKKSIRPLMA